MLLRWKPAARLSARGLPVSWCLRRSTLRGKPSGHGVLSREEFERFEHKVNRTVCQGCQNHCNLTVNLFPGGRRFLAGNRCSKPVRTEAAKAPRNLYADKLSLLDNYRQDAPDEGKQTIGIPMGLNFYDLLPFWYAFFHALGFRVLVSPNSTRELYAAGRIRFRPTPPVTLRSSCTGTSSGC